MADPAIVTANEGWKSVSRTLLQIGTVLLAAAAIESYHAGRITLETGGW